MAEKVNEGELRIPVRLILSALEDKKVKQLRLFASAKLEGHRIELKSLFKSLKIHFKTGGRLIKKMVNDGWAGTDGTFLFPRSWRKLKFSKRGGLYITKVPKDIKRFEAFCFVKALKKIITKKGSPHSNVKRVPQTDYPTGYYCSALGLKERRFKMLKARAQRYRFISVKPQFRIVGKACECEALRRNLKGLPFFKRGKHTVLPDISKIKILI